MTEYWLVNLPDRVIEVFSEPLDRQTYRYLPAVADVIRTRTA